MGRKRDFVYTPGYKMEELDLTADALLLNRPIPDGKWPKYKPSVSRKHGYFHIQTGGIGKSRINRLMELFN